MVTKPARDFQALPRYLLSVMVLMFLAVLIILLFSSATPEARGQEPPTILVPQDYPTIQGAIDAAPGGGTILVSPGVYQENLRITGKAVRLVSSYVQSGDPASITATVIDGQGRNNQSAITIKDSPGTEIHGFTIQNADNGIAANGHAVITNNRITGTVDGIDATNANMEIRNNTFEQNSDDGVDFDQVSSGIIENNVIRENENDGIEIRLHNFEGEPLDITIRRNYIANNLGDGIQVIDYPKVTPRTILIERNIIVNNAMAGIGLMDDGDTGEDFRGAPIPERIMVYNNTISGNPYGLTGGANLFAVNNIFTNSSQLAMKNVQSDSIAAYNLFWGNAVDYENSVIDPATTFSGDPLLDENYKPAPGSSAIDRGTAQFTWKGEIVLSIPPEMFSGSAPDLGYTD